MTTTYITLPARLSRILSGTLRHTPDARDIDAARRESRQLAEEHARKVMRRSDGSIPPTVEIYSCDRYGGALIDVIELPIWFE